MNSMKTVFLRRLCNFFILLNLSIISLDLRADELKNSTKLEEAYKECDVCRPVAVDKPQTLAVKIIKDCDVCASHDVGNEYNSIPDHLSDFPNYSKFPDKSNESLKPF